jgi:hypothetical protein
MENQGISTELKEFVKKIIAVDIGLLLLAGVIAFYLKLYFGIVLFGLGILSTVFGAYLGGPNPYAPKNPRISHSNPYEQPSAERLTARMLFFVKHLVPFYAFENVLLFAGLIAILFSLLFLF